MKSIPLILAVAGLASAQAPQTTSFDCAIDGSVVNSVSGEPIARARVALQGTGVASTATDSSGRWSLSNIACGSALVIVTRPGFLQQNHRGATLLPGSPEHDVRIELVPQSVFYGKVVDEEGDPVMAVQIEVWSSRVRDGRVIFQRAGGGVTNDLGEYRVAGLTRGKYIVCASVMGGAPRAGDLTLGGACYPGPVEGGSASAMELPAGRESRLDFALTLTRSVHVRGTVSGLPEGHGAGLSLVKRGADAGSGGINGPVVNNKFDLRAAAGSYMLAVDYFEGGKHLLARVPIDVGTSDIDNLAVALDSGFALTGTLKFESQSRQPAKRLQQFGINLRPSEPANGTGQVKWDTDHGSFTFVDMMPGSYRLDVFPPTPFYVKSATLAGQNVLNSEFSVSQAAGPIELVLSDDGGSIEGDVVNADGQPASGGVMALRDGKASVIQTSGQSNAHFKLQNLAPGDYKIYAWDDPSQAPYADADWMKRYAGSSVDATVAAGQNSQVKVTLQNVPQ